MKHDTDNTSTTTNALQVDELLTGPFEGGRGVGKRLPARQPCLGGREQQPGTCYQEWPVHDNIWSKIKETKDNDGKREVTHAHRPM